MKGLRTTGLQVVCDEAVVSKGFQLMSIENLLFKPILTIRNLFTVPFLRSKSHILEVYHLDNRNQLRFIRISMLGLICMFFQMWWLSFSLISLTVTRANIYLYKVNNKNRRKMFKTCSKLTTKIPLRRQCVVLEFSLLPLHMFYIFF